MWFKFKTSVGSADEEVISIAWARATAISPISERHSAVSIQQCSGFACFVSNIPEVLGQYWN